MAFKKDGTYLTTLLLIDLFSLSLAWLVYYFLRVKSGLFETATVPEIVLPLVVIASYWIILFRIFGLYRPWYAQSRTDEVITIIKTVSIGVLILFFLVFIDDAMTQDPGTSRLKIVVYWAIVIAFVSSGRIVVRSVRRRMLMAGIGHRKTLIIGTREAAVELSQNIRAHPALGYNVIGYLSTTEETEPIGASGVDHIGTLDQLEMAIEKFNIEEILITVDSSQHEELLNIIGRCSAYNVGIKIRPDLYDIISGQARTNQIYGIPLIEVTPQLMTPWEAFLKRAIDICVAFIALVIGVPLFVLIAVLQKLTSKGPVLYKQKRVGKDGKIFYILKFRTMYLGAESKTGPQWAQKDDPRVTPLGRLLRRSHLDELPQVINVLQGDMSLVGPRPERPFFVEQFVKEIPLYRRRLNVRPGITGWAQVKHTYDQSVEDVRAKLSYDLFYIENQSIRMDLKIILSTLYNMIAGKGHT